MLELLDMRLLLSLSFFIILVPISFYAEYKWKIIDNVTYFIQQTYALYEKNFVHDGYVIPDDVAFHVLPAETTSSHAFKNTFAKIKRFFSSTSDVIAPHDMLIQSTPPITSLHENEYVELPTSLLAQKLILFAVYPMKDKDITFFIIKDNTASLKDPKYRAIFNACRSCYQNKRGFTLHDGYFTCNVSGISFHKERVGIARGGCNPIVIPITKQGDTLLIEKAFLQKANALF